MRLVENPEKNRADVIFDSFSEYVQFAKDNVSRDSSSMAKESGRYAEEFTGTLTFADAISLAETGWPEGRKNVRAIANSLNIAGRVHKQEIINDVVGDCWDMGRVISGVPECAMAWEETEDMQDTGKVIKLSFDICCSGGIDKKMIRERGAAILALVDALESAGKSVEVEAIYNSGGKFHGDFCLFIPLKRAGEYLTEDILTFAVAHESMLRRLGFVNLLALGNIGITANATGCGMPADASMDIWKDLNLQVPDIYIPKMHLWEEQWQSKESTIAWIKEYLTKYGVKYE